ncbi:probable glutamate receptor [Palaemon carinicauda]|uniref:probable glutamate receptor n=1 Tax=Palaemon carinicauda TaxID=392227 RepID=UPI0035B624F6
MKEQLIIMIISILSLAINSRGNFTAKGSNVANEVSAILDSVLGSYGFRQCSVVLITAGSSTDVFITSVIKKFGGQEGFSVFEVKMETRNANLSTADESWITQQLQTVKQNSRCQTIIITSEKTDHLKILLGQVHAHGLLIWPTRLIAVTQGDISAFVPIKRELSDTNSILVLLEGNPLLKRASVYSCLPFSLRVIRTASWTPKGLQLTSPFPLFPNKFIKLIDGGGLRVASENYPPHVTVQEIRDEEVIDGSSKEVASYSGPMIQLFDILANSINFTYSLVRPPDRSWGIQRPDGSWTGMVGMIRRKEVDMAIGPFGITYLRAQVLDYTRSMFVDYVRVLAKRGKTEVDPWGFAMPLTQEVWISTLGALVVVLGVARGMHLVSLQRRESVGEIVYQYVKILLQQDLLVRSPLSSTRLLFASWMILMLVLIKSYSGNLMSLLAVRYISQPFQTLRRVEQNPGITMVWEANTAFIQTIYSAKSGIFRDVAETEKVGRFKVISSTRYSSTIEEEVMRGDHVLVVEDLSCKMLLAQHFTKTGNCEFYLSKEMFLPLTFAMVLQKNSPLGLAVNERIKAVSESGLYNHWLQRAVPNSTSCIQPPTKVTVQSSLSINNIWGIFVILVSGYIISLIAFGSEHLLSSSGCLS